MMKNTCGIEAFMPAFQASRVCLRYPGLTAWAMRYWPFRPFKQIGLCGNDLKTMEPRGIY